MIERVFLIEIFQVFRDDESAEKWLLKLDGPMAFIVRITG